MVLHSVMKNLELAGARGRTMDVGAALRLKRSSAVKVGCETASEIISHFTRKTPDPDREPPTYL